MAALSEIPCVCKDFRKPSKPSVAVFCFESVGVGSFVHLIEVIDFVVTAVAVVVSSTISMVMLAAVAVSSLVTMVTAAAIARSSPVTS